VAFLNRLQPEQPIERRMKTGKTTRAIVGLWICLACSFPLQSAEDVSSVANKVKAAYLFNFAKFVEWPQECFQGKDSPIRVCVLGKDPVAAEIQTTLKGMSIDGHPLEVRVLPEGGEVRDCHLLYVCASEKSQLTKILGSQHTKHVLTVSDIEHFNEDGGMIFLHKEGNNIRFEINQKEAEKAGLKISSKLLQLAKRGR
jgi:hypothetical protein